MREQFARVMTEVAQEAGQHREYTALSHAARGMKIKPTAHLGAHKTRLVREGEYVSTDARNRARIKRNEAMLELERLKRRRAAMERRLARVRLIETRTVTPVHRASRPVQAVRSEVRRTAAMPRTRSTRPVVGSPTAIHRGAAVDASVNKLALVSPPPEPSMLVVEVPMAAFREVSGLILRTPVVTMATRPTATSATPTPAIAARVCPDASTRPIAGPAALDVQRPLAPQVRLEAPVLSSRPQFPETANIVAASPPARPQEGGKGPRVMVPSVVHLTTTSSETPVVARATSANRRTDRSDVTIETIVPVVGRATGTARSATSLATVSRADRSSPAASGLDRDLLHAAFGERAVRRRARSKAGAPQAVLAAIARIDWATPPSEPDGALDQVEALDLSEPMTAPTTAISKRISAADFYIHDDGAGRLDLDPRAVAALGTTDAFLDRETEQAALADIRRDQQRIFGDLVAQAERRPLDFSVTGPKPWPRDLDPPALARLDRWSRDEGFHADLFIAIDRTVREAHDRHARTMRDRSDHAQAPVVVQAPRRLARPISDGFGGWRDIAPPVFEVSSVGPRVHAFDEATGTPSRPLLILLHYCGEHPGQIAFATDGRLAALPRTPGLIDPLVRMWRHDDVIQALIVETVTASRKAGRAVWPARYAAAIRAIVPSPPPPGTPPRDDRDISR